MRMGDAYLASQRLSETEGMLPLTALLMTAMEAPIPLNIYISS